MPLGWRVEGWAGTRLLFALSGFPLEVRISAMLGQNLYPYLHKSPLIITRHIHQTCDRMPDTHTHMPLHLFQEERNPLCLRHALPSRVS